MSSSRRGLVLLTAIAAAAEMVRRLCGLPIPGPILGVILLVTIFAFRGAPLASIKAGSRPLLAHLSLMFIPLATAITTQLGTIVRHGLPVAAALCGSSILALLTTALVLRGLDRLLDAPSRGASPHGASKATR